MRTPLLLLACNVCLAIRVPVAWDYSVSEVKHNNNNNEQYRFLEPAESNNLPNKNNDEQFSVESFHPQNVPLNVDSQNKPIPEDYFQYTAQKPQFAINIAKFHGVQSPENHYKAYPVKPYTGQAKPELGKHHLLDPKNTVHKPLQEFANINEGVANHAVPVSSNYEVFHPYEAETPALQEIYKDPILNKIRNDLENSKYRLQNYENDAGEPDIHKNEYLEPPEKTDHRFVPHKNIPAPYEIHRPQRRPVYYRPVPKNPHREQYLNQRLRHPWNQYSAKIRPFHYRPIKNHIHQLRQNHALKYDDERNEYPQVQIMENLSSDPKDGYDIYEKGKENFERIRNNVDESITKAVIHNRPATYEKLEMQNNDSANDEEDKKEFVPIKNYAQVRKSETYKHLPKTAAFAEAENFDEIRNAPRLREAVKSTKAQTVYSEEGYEDTAYDHAGEQKHASENEAHGGFLKEHELSGGKYKTPSESAKYEDAGGSAYRDQALHAEKWKDDDKDYQDETHEEDYSETDHEHSVEADGLDNPDNEDYIHRNKREGNLGNDKISENSSTTDVDDTLSMYEIEKSNFSFKVPDIDLNSTYLTEKEIIQLGKIKNEPKKDDVKQKYPYYFQKLKAISKHSPLRYAEDLKHIPKKSGGGTEFYDSRSVYECPEVDDVPDPIPEKLKGEGHPDESDNENEENSGNKGDENYATAKKSPRLKGLGDKIDCFKAKYFGENPLDSPFFKEEIISNPEPVSLPNLGIFKLKGPYFDQKKLGSEIETIFIENNLKSPGPEMFDVLEKFRNNQNHQDSVLKSSKNLQSQNSLDKMSNLNSTQSNLKQQTTLDNIQDNFNNKTILTYKHQVPVLLNANNDFRKYNITNQHFQNAKDITKPPTVVRKKRSTSFVYEPYKIIRDSQVQDSKKTTTTSSIGPLRRQLQSSRIVDRVPRPTQDFEKFDNPVKRNVRSRAYKDIGRRDRKLVGSKNDKGTTDPTIVDVSLDSRRGEPRYEIKQTNHKSRYTPVENKKALSVSDYKVQTGTNENFKSKGDNGNQRQARHRVTQSNPNLNEQNEAASSNTVKKNISTTFEPEKTRIELTHKNDDYDEDYEQYDDDEEEDEEEEETVTTTTTTTQNPNFRRQIGLSTTAETKSTEKPRLKLVTRFRSYNPDQEDNIQNTHDAKSRVERVNTKNKQDSDESAPKYREKKKKSSKSTLVTDTKRYGDDDHDMRKEEVDALIGVKENMSDYMPLYEKEEDEKLRQAERSESDSDENDERNESVDIEEDNDDEDNDDEDDEDEVEGPDEDEEGSSESIMKVTTSVPTKRTLPMTTDAPLSTLASRTIKPETKPIVTRKKIEIHKELPVIKSSPHVTQFKQDIKEVEIVKEIAKMPRRKPHKNYEALELYKDDSLAKDVNKLGGVEIFKDNIDLKNGPRHGGNYRNLEEPSLPTPLRSARKKGTKEDAEASQSEFTRHVELEDDILSRNQMHGGNLRSLNDALRTRSRGRNSKLIDVMKPSAALTHGGSLNHRGRGNNSRSQKLIELDDEEQSEKDPSNDHESFSSSENPGPMHGGNYRSEQLVATEKPKVETTSRNRAQNARKTSAAILSSFVQAAPVLTSTPKYILDPSKRVYYYVDV